MRIGDFARLANVSVRTLRFYGQAGLLPPAYTDAANGYRHYDGRQLVLLHQIRAFQEMGLSLGKIRELLNRGLPAAEFREILRERRAFLVRQIQNDAERLARIDARLSALNSNLREAAPAVVLRVTRPAWVVSLREKIRRYEEAEEMFLEVERRVRPGLVARERAALWHTCAHEGPAIDCEVLRFLKRPISIRGSLRAYQIPSLTVAAVFHSKGDSTLSDSYSVLTKWLARSSYRLCGPKREIYWLEAANGAESDSLTEVQFPVVQASGAKRHSWFHAA